LEAQRRRGHLVLEGAAKLLAGGKGKVPDVCYLLFESPSGRIHTASGQFRNPAVPDPQSKRNRVFYGTIATDTISRDIAAVSRKRAPQRSDLLQRVALAVFPEL
jgi:hypothetical protein